MESNKQMYTICGKSLLNKGFTLIELLAVIVILAIIALIVTPIILNTINDAKEKSYDISVENIIRTANLYDISSQLTDTEILMDQNIYQEVKKNLNGSVPDDGVVYIKSSTIGGQRQIAFALQYGEWCYTKAYGDPVYEKKKTDNCQVPFDYLIKEKQIDYKVKGEEYFLWKDADTTKAIKRNQIESIEIKPSNKVSENAIHSWDVSQDKTGKVMAWYEDMDKDELYEVYIGQNGGVKANQDSQFLFAYLTNVESIDVTYLDTSQVTNMYYMFVECENLTTLDVSNFNTSKVGTNLNNAGSMGYMFSGCKTLENLDLNNFDTSNVISMSGMFSNCENLVSLNISNFNTSKVTNMASMFSGCSKLTSLDLSSFDTSQVGTDTNSKGMQYMFYRCSGLTELDLSNFNTSQVNDMSFMFSGASNLTTITIGCDWITASDTTNMFSSSGKYKLEQFNTLVEETQASCSTSE